MRAAGRVRRVGRRLVRRLAPASVILAYHRISDEAIDPFSLAVSEANFAEQLEVIAEEMSPVALGELTAALRAGKPPRRAVAVTFDDGYADNLHAGLPLLSARGVPATVFVASSFVDSAGGPWWDRVAAALLEPAFLPGELTLRIEGRERSWSLEHQGPPAVGWSALLDEPAGARAEVFLSLWQRLLPLEAEAREETLAELGEWASRAAPPASERRMLSSAELGMLTSAELRELATSELIAIGAHTVTHPVLARLGVEAQRRELVDSRRWLEERIDAPVTNLAYPYGSPASFDATTRSLARSEGFTSAYSTEPRAVRAGDDPFALPRLTVGDWTAEELRGRLAAALRT